MRDLINGTVQEFLSVRMNLDSVQQNTLGNAIELLAYYGGMLNIKDIASFSGLSTERFLKDIRSITGEIHYGDMFNRAKDNHRWVDRPSTEEFLCSMTAELIEYGWWVETAEEPSDRKIAREFLSRIAPASIVRRPSELRGYLAVLEYLWCSMRGMDLKPASWIKRRYGAKSDAKKDIKGYLTALVKSAGDFGNKEAKEHSTVILAGLARTMKQELRNAENGYVSTVSPTSTIS